MGGLLIVHWWWISLQPNIESSLPEFFLSHLLLAIGIWFLSKKVQYGRKVAIICGLFFFRYGFVMATLLIPGGLEEIGVFAFVIPVFLAAIGVVLGAGSFFSACLVWRRTRAFARAGIRYKITGSSIAVGYSNVRHIRCVAF